MAGCLVALGVQRRRHRSSAVDFWLQSFRYRMALNQVPQDADPSDPLAYVSWK